MMNARLLCITIFCIPALGARSQTIVIPASNFVADLPKGNIITDARSANVEWLFNNTAVVLKSESNMAVWVDVPSPGLYHLFVKSHGKTGNGFRVGVGNEISQATFGDRDNHWANGGSFTLARGRLPIKITRIQPGSSFDVIVLTTKTSMTDEDVKPFQLHDDVKLLAQYTIPDNTSVKFGDVNGDGQTDMLVLSPDFSATVIDNNGKTLWTWKSPASYARERSGFEAPGLIWDFDNDGKGEVVHWRMDESGKELLAIASGSTGQLITSVEWPTMQHPHVYNNFRLAIAQLTANRPNEIVVFTDMGGRIRVDAYSSLLKPLWTFSKELKKDHLGHYLYPIDLTGDGVDEVLVGCVLLDASGKILWDRFDYFTDHHDHADSHKFHDLDDDGKPEIVTANSETGVFVFESESGAIRWHQVAEHAQQIQSGLFLDGVVRPQIVVGARTYGNRSIGEPYLSSQLHWFSHDGMLIKKWPSTPVNGNPDFVKGHWDGQHEALFWYKFRINGKGEGELYFPDPVYHMFDFNGDGSEDVITLNGTALKVFGSRHAVGSGKDLKSDAVYRKATVANHTHY